MRCGALVTFPVRGCLPSSSCDRDEPAAALEGEPGTGKTSLAQAWASLAPSFIRLQCYEGIEASQALYDWDFARQILHIRAVEAAAGDDLDVRALEDHCSTSGSCWSAPS